MCVWMCIWVCVCTCVCMCVCMPMWVTVLPGRRFPGSTQDWKDEWDPGQAERVGSQEARIQSIWLGENSPMVAVRPGHKIKSRCFRAPGGIHLQVAELWCSTAHQDLGIPWETGGSCKGKVRPWAPPPRCLSFSVSLDISIQFVFKSAWSFLTTSCCLLTFVIITLVLQIYHLQFCSGADNYNS